MHGLVNPNTRKTTYWFELGTTLAYGTSTNPASAGKGDKPVTVTSGIGNLSRRRRTTSASWPPTTAASARART